jgi:glutamate synthase domain-containing protein 3
MCGGEIIVVPPANAKFVPCENIIIGNTVMYGATGGHLFAAGQAGERFCVRNSGGQAVVEGVGDHGCEYMTNGLVVIIGPTGKNFGAGMTGGVAYVLDEDGTFPERYNKEIVKLSRMKAEDVVIVQSLIYRHLELTESAKAKAILADWKTFQDKFWKVAPEPVEVKATPAEAKKMGEAIVATTPPPATKK